MNWDAVSAIGEVFGGLLVLATLLFLAHQIRQSNRLGQAEAQRDWFAKWNDIMRATAETADVATLFRKGLHSYSTLEKSEKAVFSGYLISMLDHADVLRRLNEQKLVADDMTQPVIKVKPSNSKAKSKELAEREAAIDQEMDAIAATIDYKDPADQQPKPSSRC